MHVSLCFVLKCLSMTRLWLAVDGSAMPSVWHTKIEKLRGFSQRQNQKSHQLISALWQAPAERLKNPFTMSLIWLDKGLNPNLLTATGLSIHYNATLVIPPRWKVFRLNVVACEHFILLFYIHHLAITYHSQVFRRLADFKFFWFSFF